MGSPFSLIKTFLFDPITEWIAKYTSMSHISNSVPITNIHIYPTLEEKRDIAAKRLLNINTSKCIPLHIKSPHNITNSVKSIPLHIKSPHNITNSVKSIPLEVNSPHNITNSVKSIPLEVNSLRNNTYNDAIEDKKYETIAKDWLT